MNASFLLSGDHCGAYRKPAPSEVTLRSGAPPSTARNVSSYSPLRSLQYATVFPSGDQRGYRSTTPDDRVTFTAAPNSAGTVKTSPRASNTARLPVGETAADRMSDSAFAVLARNVVSSVTTCTGTSAAFSDARSSR